MRWRAFWVWFGAARRLVHAQNNEGVLCVPLVTGRVVVLDDGLQWGLDLAAEDPKIWKLHGRQK